MGIIDVIGNIGFLPVINITDIETAEPLAKTLIESGVPVIEVVLRNEKSLDAIKIIRNSFPEMNILAGTILSVETAKKALEAGADGIVLPGYDEEIVDFAIKNNVPIVPGCVTPAEVQNGIKKGLKVFKYFPSEPLGGVPAMQLLSGPFKGVKFLPTGEITFDNLGRYLKNDFILACGGSFMANAATLKSRDFDKIKNNCKKAIDISLNFKLAHIGINHDDGDSAYKNAEIIASAFGFDVRRCGGADFAGDAVECMHNSRLGEKGHIGFSTNSIQRAMAYLSAKGIEFDESSIKRDAEGNITCIYFKEQVAGFALHIVKN